MEIRFLSFLTISFLSFGIASQSKTKVVIPTDSLYNENIKKSRLYGVYIPRDIDDAMVKLMELTDEKARLPLKTLDETTMSTKLYFGLGRWMAYNWNFEEGSRLSHYLRQRGLIYTEDMTRFMLVSFHRHINNRPLESEHLILQFISDRNKKIKESQDKMQVISSEKKIIPKNE